MIPPLVKDLEPHNLVESFFWLLQRMERVLRLGELRVLLSDLHEDSAKGQAGEAWNKFTACSQLFASSLDRSDEEDKPWLDELQKILVRGLDVLYAH